MPELPEVETVRCGLAPAMENARFIAVEARRRDLRCPLPDRFAERLLGQTVRALRRRAKYLLADLSSDDVLVMHLGMSGSFRVERDELRTAPGAFHFDRSQDRAHDHVVFRMSSGARITYNDPRRFGLMLLLTPNQFAAHSLMSGIGPEPLGNGFNAGVLASACAGRKTSLKAALLDQKMVAGLGNIYACEALHRAGLSPKRKASCLAARGGNPTPSAERLVVAIRSVLRDAIRRGGSSLRDHRQTDGGLGYFQHHFRVYDRQGEACTTKNCSGRVVRIVQQGRSTFYCPKCQR